MTPVLAEDDRGGVRLPVGLAELRVDYLERNGRGQLREAEARAGRVAV